MGWVPFTSVPVLHYGSPHNLDTTAWTHNPITVCQLRHPSTKPTYTACLGLLVATRKRLNTTRITYKRPAGSVSVPSSHIPYIPTEHKRSTLWNVFSQYVGYAPLKSLRYVYDYWLRITTLNRHNGVSSVDSTPDSFNTSYSCRSEQRLPPCQPPNTYSISHKVDKYTHTYGNGHWRS